MEAQAAQRGKDQHRMVRGGVMKVQAMQSRRQKEQTSTLVQGSAIGWSGTALCSLHSQRIRRGNEKEQEGQER